ncbi:MAG: hypothetical protein E6Y86_08640, partial [Slackia sp.]|nr:hypothetical protein [Slackia sp.]
MQVDASQHEALAVVGESNVGTIDHNRILYKHVWPLHVQRPAWGGGALFRNAALKEVRQESWRLTREECCMFTYRQKKEALELFDSL